MSLNYASLPYVKKHFCGIFCAITYLYTPPWCDITPRLIENCAGKSRTQFGARMCLRLGAVLKSVSKVKGKFEGGKLKKKSLWWNNPARLVCKWRQKFLSDSHYKPKINFSLNTMKIVTDTEFIWNSVSPSSESIMFPSLEHSAG